MTHRFYDHRLVSPAYDFRFFGAGTPIAQAKAEVSRVMRLVAAARQKGNEVPGYLCDDLGRANRMLWAARHQDEIVATSRLPAHVVWAIQRGAKVEVGAESS